MKIGVPKEGEARVAAVPETVKGLVKKGHEVFVERGAGLAAFIPDAEFEAAGAKIVSDAASIYRDTDCVFKVTPPTTAEAAQFHDGQALISFLWHMKNTDLVQALAKKKVTSFSMDAIPRITRAQSMDALSSMSTISGYKAVILAADHLPKFFPMLTTAAGTIRPAQAFILGAGVAGLQAIATARRLGAVVEAFDARPVVKEQVQSLGATFVELKEQSSEPAQDKYGYAKEVTADVLAKQQQLIHDRLKVADFAITTALVPGKPAPCLITRAMVDSMKPGSVVVDLAGEAGGNCQLSKAGETVRHGHVTIIAPLNLAATMPLDASRMYSRNVLTLFSELTNKDKAFTFDWNNEVFRETCITHGGDINSRRGGGKA